MEMAHIIDAAILVALAVTLITCIRLSLKIRKLQAVLVEARPAIQAFVEATEKAERSLGRLSDECPEGVKETFTPASPGCAGFGGESNHDMNIHAGGQPYQRDVLVGDFYKMTKNGGH